MCVEFEFSLQRWHVLPVDLEGEGPETSLPNLSCLCVSDSQVVFIINALRGCCKVRACNVVPEANNNRRSNSWPTLEPTFRVDIIQCKVRVSFKWTPSWETVWCVFFCHNTKWVNNIRDLVRPFCQCWLLEIIHMCVKNSLFKAEILVVVFSDGSCGPLAHPLGTVTPVVSSQREQIHHRHLY